MTVYVPPEIADHDLVSRRDCIARAQRALEVAELSLEALAKVNGGRLSTEDTIAHAVARAQIGRGWADLAAAIGGGR